MCEKTFCFVGCHDDSIFSHEFHVMILMGQLVVIGADMCISSVVLEQVTQFLQKGVFLLGFIWHLGLRWVAFLSYLFLHSGISL